MSSVIQNKAELMKKLLQHRNEIEKHHIKKLGIFGSFTKDQVSKSSDVDFLVEFQPGEKNYTNFIQLAEYLEMLCNRKVELLTQEALSPYLADIINNEVEYVIGS